MKPLLAVLFVFVAIATPLLAQEKDPSSFGAKSTLEGKTVFKFGETISFKIECNYPDTYLFCGWNVFAYLKNIPEDFCKTLNLKPDIAQDPQWSSVQFQPYQWLPAAQRTRKKMVCSFSTEKWPAGDYRLSISLLFQGKEGSKKLPDVYREKNIVFTLEK